MAFVDGVVIAVPHSNRESYAGHAAAMADVFIACGAIEVVDAWAADVPEGKLTSFPMSVKANADEAVVFSWIKWPDKATRDAGWEQAMKHPGMTGLPPDLFDAQRMIYGGFDIIQSRVKA